MTRLIATRGAAGVRQDHLRPRPAAAGVRVNRDDLRRMLHGARLHTSWAERQVTVAQRAQVEALLRAGISVCVRRHEPALPRPAGVGELAARFGADFEVHDFTDVPLAECLRRDAGGRSPTGSGRRSSSGCTSASWPGARCRCRCRRSAPAPPATVYAPPAAGAGDRPGRHRRHGRADSRPQPVRHAPGRPGPAQRRGHLGGPRPCTPPATGSSSAPGATSRRGPTPRCGWTRTSACRTWRCTCAPSATTRKDAVVKREIFDREIRDRYRVVGVFDDRMQVCGCGGRSG